MVPHRLHERCLLRVLGRVEVDNPSPRSARADLSIVRKNASRR